MNSKIDKSLVAQAINNCQSIEYPILVNGQDFGDDLANALTVIGKLLQRVDALESYIIRESYK